MNAWIALLIGFILGLLVKWVYDNFRGSQDSHLDSQKEELQNQLTTLESENKGLRESLDRSPDVIVKEKDNLEKIKGVGPVFATRFNEAGIYTFADLAAISPERAHDIIKPKEWQAIDPESWIAEAQSLDSSDT